MPETAVSPVSPTTTATVVSLLAEAARAPGPSTALATCAALAPTMPSAVAAIDAALMAGALITALLELPLDAQRSVPVHSDAVTVTVVLLLLLLLRDLRGVHRQDDDRLVVVLDRHRPRRCPPRDASRCRAR